MHGIDILSVRRAGSSADQRQRLTYFGYVMAVLRTARIS